MGRRPTKPGAISRLRERRRGNKIHYYYDTGEKPRREIPLGSDYGLAITRYAELEKSRTADKIVAAVVTFRYVSERYIVDVVPTKSAGTQKKNHQELKKLREFFEGAPLEAIEPQHVRQYIRWRKDAPVSANREKALLSHIWNYAREVGYTALANPCAGVKGNKEAGRDVYVEDDLYAQVYAKADQGLRDAMDLLYLTGQRPGDVLKLDDRDIKDGRIGVIQNKTGAKRRIEIEGELAAVIDRIKARKQALKVYPTRIVVTEDGLPMTSHMLRDRFDLARDAAGVAKKDFQMRDLRAKAGTDKAESSGDILQARDQLGHTSVVMTETYIRKRRGKLIKPTK